MRIIAGSYKNRMIHAPRTKSLDSSTSMTREALFNILGEEILETRFADLYAGSGSVGLEAISRGAARVTFVENQKKIASTIRHSLKILNISRDQARVWVNDVFKLAESNNEWVHWDIAFLDPPRMVKEDFLDKLVRRGVLGNEKLIVVERPVENCTQISSKLLPLLDYRVYGKASLFFFEGSYTFL